MPEYKSLRAERCRDLLLGILFPRRCPVCRNIVEPEGTYICPACRKRLSLVQTPRCFRCGKPIADECQEYCRDCRVKKRSFEQGRGLLVYQSKENLTKRILMDFKFHNRREYAEALADEMMRELGGEIRSWKIQAVTPVPVHPSKLRSRGYNQAALLAEALARRLQLPVAAGLHRIRKTVPQKELNDRQRLENLLRAFCADETMGQWQRILLVDDIYTTGSTAEACTRALLTAGVKHVYVVCAAIGGEKQEWQ